MKNFLFTTMAAGTVASAAVGLATTAHAAPSGPSSVDETVNELRSRGYQVIVNRVDSSPLDQCTVSAIRPGQTYSRTDSSGPGAGDHLVTTIIHKTVYVNVSC